MKPFYITTTLPYVNAKPHIGFAMEIVRADCLARWQRLLGNEVFFNTGVDEHGLKIYNQAKELGIEPQAYCDEMAAKFSDLKEALNLSYNNFIRTTDAHHVAAAQEFWRRSKAHGDIYKKNYSVKYCVGCELEKTESELVNGHCPLHPDKELELIEEENYFFAFSKYQQPLLDFYKANPDFVKPETKLKEISKFVEGGLTDFSISRLKSKMPWGVAVPDDESQVMYVWFDALINYISCLGWPCDYKGSLDTARDDNSCDYCRFWPGLQICGKDNLRQQTAMWQAMLMSVSLPNSRQVLVNGFINSDGQKMSKSLGNVVDPLDLVNQYGTDAVRYYLLAGLNSFEDSDYTTDKFQARYQADLANGLGNLVARVSNLLEKNNLKLSLNTEFNQKLLDEVGQCLTNFAFSEAIEVLWSLLRQADETISHSEPWKMTDQAELKKCLEPIAQTILDVAQISTIFIPATAEKIVKQFSAEQIKKESALFPRI